MNNEVDLEVVVLSHLHSDDDYTRKVLPYLKEEYFTSDSKIVLFKVIRDYIEENGSNPTVDAIKVQLGTMPGLNEHLYQNALELTDHLTREKSDSEWLLKKTEEWCKNRALYNAILTASASIDGIDKNAIKPEAIPDLLSDALSISFDSHVGHDYLEDTKKRHDYYTSPRSKIKFDIDVLNEKSNGGVLRKTMAVLMAATNVGKSLIMCHCAAGNLREGYDVLYFTMEMTEEAISRRIDANILNFPIEDLEKIDYDEYQSMMDKVRPNIKGKLFVKEFPTGTATSTHFRSVLKELKLKKNFVPDVIYVDYINICASSKLKAGGQNSNSYAVIKSISEELRAIAQEYDLALITATQTNREGMANMDLELGNVSESVGITHTVDLILGIATDAELQNKGQYLFKILKVRNGGKSGNPRFLVGVDTNRMKLYNIDQQPLAASMATTSATAPVNFQSRQQKLSPSLSAKLIS